MNKFLCFVNAVIAFMFVCFMFAFIAWCGGYDFDKRGPDLGLMVFYTFVFGGIAAAAAYYNTRINQRYNR